MAPNRRKSKASSAAAAAAAKRRWKVGDLVLAKMKGFPAWPAVVSDPTKWGYAVDWKKVMVFFYGTSQIAFCNPTDVESFTEEKKESLLGKRHGKGADYVRAVKEIIENYDDLIKNNELDDSNAAEEVIPATNGNQGDSLASSNLLDQTESSQATFKSQSNGNGTRDKDMISSPAEDAPANSPHDRQTLSQEPTDSVIIAETALATTCSSRKRSGSTQINCQLKKRRDIRSRNSSRSHNLVVSSNDANNNVKDMTSYEVHDGSVGMDKQNKVSSDASDSHVANLPPVIPTDSIEENGSEIVTVDSDPLSLNDGGTFEFGNNLKHGVRELESGKQHDFQIKPHVVMKEMKLNRKGVASDACDVLDKVAGGDVKIDKGDEYLSNACVKLDTHFCKEEGDEHLPLVKRARVRMRKHVAIEEKLDHSMMMEENTKEDVTVNELGHTSLNCAQDSSVDREPLAVKDNVVNSSPLNSCPHLPESSALGCESRKNQASGSLDGEAALPPSKRLHRALEAMSANVAEDDLACALTPLTNGCHDSPLKCHYEFNGSKSENSLEKQNVDCNGQFSSKTDSGEFSAYVNHSLNVEPTVSTETSKDQCEITQNVAIPHLAIKVSHDLDGRHDTVRNNRDSSHQLSLKNEDKCEIMKSSHNKAESPIKEAEAANCSTTSTDHILEADVITKGSSQDDTSVHLYYKDTSGCDNAQSWKIPPDGDSQADTMCYTVSETSNQSSQFVQKVSTPMSGANNSYDSASFSDDVLSVKDVTGIQSGSSPADRTLLPARDSPSFNALYHFAKSGSNNIVGTREESKKSIGCGSSKVELHEDRRKAVRTLDADEEKADSAVTSVGKSHAEITVCLTAFETLLGGLTRAKESIGRATRIAIDCAKYGASSKVLNILARHMENEPSLSKRVDFFFLVDSITQCSRGLKGDVHGAFASAVQSALPRLLAAAAPPGNTARENRRQCLKVLRLWMERRTLPESIVHHHMRHLDSLNWSSCPGAASRRPLRNERAFDDPLREMEGMLVDEYGSNSSLQIQGLSVPNMLKVEDDRSDSDGGSFEAVTPENNSETPEVCEPTPSIGKYKHILEDVDGDLEMEDVAPSCETVTSTFAHTPNHKQYIPSSLPPPLPNDIAHSSPPLPISPPPLPPPPPLAHPPAFPGTYTNGVDAKLYVGANTLPESVPVVVHHGSMNYNMPECQSYQMDTRLPDSSATCSYVNFNGSHVPMGRMNNVPRPDGEVMHNRVYHLPPPPPPPSNHFPYAHADPQAHSWRDPPYPHYSNRHHFPPNMDGAYYTDHDRSNPREYSDRSNPRGFNDRSHPHEFHDRPHPREFNGRSNPREFNDRSNPREFSDRSNARDFNPHECNDRSSSHEFNERWRYNEPPFSDPYYPHDRARAPSAPGSHFQGEPYRTRDQGWSHHSPEMGYRNAVPIRPPCEDDRYWRPR